MFSNRIEVELSNQIINFGKYLIMEISKRETIHDIEATTCTTTQTCLGDSLRNSGYELIAEQNIPLTYDEWLRLEFLTEEQNLPYSQGNLGDTQEALSMKVFRIKTSRSKEILHLELMTLIGSPKMLDFYRRVCGNNKLIIDRCQAHLYKKDDFIARHIDRDSYEDYEFSILIAISQDFTGGEMILYQVGKIETANKFKLPNRTALIADSGIPHEVLPLQSGIRKTIALFLMNEDK